MYLFYNFLYFTFYIISFTIVISFIAPHIIFYIIFGTVISCFLAVICTSVNALLFNYFKNYLKEIFALNHV